jgi:NAD(P)H-dependent FMN reductase
MRRRVVAFAASSSRHSINRQLLDYAAGLLVGTEVEFLDLNDFELPLFSVDREAQLGQPELAREFFRLIGEADGVVVSFAEHNGCYSAAYKNIYDWASRIDPKVYQGKPMVLLATSPGRRGGRSVLDLALDQVPRFGGDVRASLSVPSFNDNFDTDAGRLRNAELDRELKTVMRSLFER